MAGICMILAWRSGLGSITTLSGVVYPLLRLSVAQVLRSYYAHASHSFRWGRYKAVAPLPRVVSQAASRPDRRAHHAAANSVAPGGNGCDAPRHRLQRVAPVSGGRAAQADQYRVTRAHSGAFWT